MEEIKSISYSFYDFLKEEEDRLYAYFANADKWEMPWEMTATMEDARVVIVNFSLDDEVEKIERLKQDFPKAEVIVFSAKKPEIATWHLERQPNGKTPIVAFSKLVLKISHALKRKKPEGVSSKTKTATPTITAPSILHGTELNSMPDLEEFEPGPADMSSFFNQLDSLLDSKPNEKRKRFNEK